MCIDYQELNKVIVKNKYFLPRIDSLFDQLREAVMFLKIDLKSRCHKVKQDIPKTTFHMRYEYFQFVVMSFRLMNAPTLFMHLINKVFQNYLDKFIVVFINDILVYSKSHKEYKDHLRFIVQRLREKQLYTKFLKCEFQLYKVAFLGHIALVKGI